MPDVPSVMAVPLVVVFLLVVAVASVMVFLLVVAVPSVSWRLFSDDHDARLLWLLSHI